MAQTTFTVRMDADTKRDFSELCSSIGITMSTAFSIFAKKAVSEQRIPFELTANTDRSYSVTNINHHDKIIDDVENEERTLEINDLITADNEWIWNDGSTDTSA